jgi:hypothetical protein
VIVGIAIWTGLSIGTASILNKIKYNLGEEWCGTIVFVTFVLCLIGWLNFAVNHLHVNEITMVKDFEYNIYALEDNRGIVGRRYYLETNTTYDYLANYKEGKKQYSVNKNNSYIVEYKSAIPHIEVYKAMPAKETRYTKFMFTSYDKEYKIVVPEKTLTNEFNVDLK